MKTIDTHELELVTGGKAHPLTTIGGDTASSSGNEQLLATLQGIQGSLKDLGKNQNSGLFGGNSGLLFMTMALAMSRRNDVVVYGGGGGGWHGGFRIRAYW